MDTDELLVWILDALRCQKNAPQACEAMRALIADAERYRKLKEMAQLEEKTRSFTSFRERVWNLRVLGASGDTFDEAIDGLLDK